MYKRRNFQHSLQHEVEKLHFVELERVDGEVVRSKERKRGVCVRGGGDPSSFEVEQTSEGVTIGGKVAILDSTLASSQDFNELIQVQMKKTVPF